MYRIECSGIRHEQPTQEVGQSGGTMSGEVVDLSQTIEIFNPTLMDTLPVTEAVLNEQLNEAGSLRFTLAYGNPGYGLIDPMACFVTAYDDDETIFYGRVLEAGKPSFSGTISYECEGALSFLNDSEVTPNKNAVTRTAQQMFEWCINQHNADIGNDPRRTFEVGQVTISEKNKSEKYQISSFTQTKTVIENNLLNVYGGYLRVRIEGGHRYIDWVKNYSAHSNDSPVTIGENVMEKAFTESGDNLYTVLRPVGKNGLLLDTPTIDVFPFLIDRTRYGRIVKSVSFSDAATKAKLQERAEEYIDRLYTTLLCSGTIKMVDMHYLDGSIPKLHLGDRFSHIEGFDGTRLTIASLERDLIRPYIGDCSFGNDRSLHDTNSGKGGGASISKATSRAGSSAAQNFKHIIELGDQVTINAENLSLMGDTLSEHYNIITTQANTISNLSLKTEGLEEWLGEQDTRLQTVEGTGVIQNTELLTSFAGTMRLKKDNNGNIIGIEFVDGTMVMETKDGHMVTVGQAIANNTQGLLDIQGSALWTNRDNITGVCGQFQIDEGPPPRLIIVSGGGMVIKENNVEYGIYHEGNLTGGLMVRKINEAVITTINGTEIHIGDNNTLEISITAQDLAQFGLLDPEDGELTAGFIVDKLNNGHTRTRIKGDVICIGSDLSKDDLETWAKDAEDGKGVFAKYLTVKHLDAQDITTLLANISQADIENLNITGTVTAEIIDTGEDGGITTGSINASEYLLNDEPMNVLDITKSQDGKTLTITKTNGESFTFEKAVSSNRFRVNWNGSIQEIDSDPNGVEYYQCYIKNGGMEWESNKKSGYITVEVMRVSGASEYKESSMRFYVPATDSYNAGWNAARNVTNNNLPSTIGAYVDGVYKTIEIVIPNTNGSSSNTTHSYTLTKNNSFTPTGSSSAIHVVELKEGSNVVARIDAQSFYTDGNAAGQTTGKNAVTLEDPVWNSISGSTPSSRTCYVRTKGRLTQLEKSIPLFLTKSDFSSHKCTVYMRMNSATGNVYAQIEVDATSEYTSGQTNGKNAVTLTDPVWNSISGSTPSSRTCYVRTSGRPTQLEKSIPLYLTKSSFSSHKCTVYMRMNSTSGTVYAQIEVDATSEHTAGKKAATLTGPTWTYTPEAVNQNNYDNNTVKVANSDNADTYKSVKLVLTQDSSFNASTHKKFVYMRMSSSSGSIYAKTEVDATAVYDAGKSYGRKNVRVTNPLDSLPDGYSVGLSKTLSYKTNGTRELYFRVSRIKDDGSGYTYDDGSRQVYHLTVDVQVPTGSTYSKNATLYCSSITTGTTGVKTVTLTVQYAASQSVPFTQGSSKKVYFN